MQVSGDVAYRRLCWSQAMLRTGDNVGLRRYCAQATMQTSDDVAHRRQCRSKATLRTGDNADL